MPELKPLRLCGWAIRCEWKTGAPNPYFAGVSNDMEACRTFTRRREAQEHIARWKAGAFPPPPNLSVRPVQITIEEVADA